MTLAHTGHWYHSLLYLLPVLLISAGLWWSGRRVDREPHAAEDAGDEPASRDEAPEL